MTTDHADIPELLRGSPEQRQKAIRIIVTDQKLKSEIMTYVSKQSGQPDDALAIFHDSVIVFAKKIFTDRNLVINTSHSAYIFGIAKNLWLLHIRKEKKYALHTVSDDVEPEKQGEDFANMLFKKEKISLLHEVLNHLISPCKEVLLYWAGGYSMEEIAGKLGYKTEGVARKKKFLCFKFLLDWLESRPDIFHALKYDS